MRLERLAGVVVVLLLMGFCSIAPRQTDTENTILAAQRACEAQTGKPCSIP